jgi:hypothetical protein
MTMKLFTVECDLEIDVPGRDSLFEQNGSSVSRTRRPAGNDFLSLMVSLRRLPDRADGCVRPTLYPRDIKVS